MDTITLHGATIPKLGFGTWQLKGDDAYKSVQAALETGYRHIDTAQAYENEQHVGRAMAESGVARSDVWLTTKVWMSNMGPDKMLSSVRESLEKLRTDKVDLLLLHWPNEDYPFEQMIESLNAARDQGLTAQIGVSNYTAAQIDRAVKTSAGPLICNQVEYHPFLDQTPVLQRVRHNGMALTAYSPIAQGKVFGHDVIKAIGRTHGKTEAQVALRWLVQQPDVIAIPRSSKPEHAAANFDVFDFELSDDEMGKIFDLHRPDGRMIDPDWAPEWDTAA